MAGLANVRYMFSMDVAPALSVANPPEAGGAVSGGQGDGMGPLRLVQWMMDTGMAMARRINRIARQRLEGQPLSQLAPAGFNATLTNALVGQGVAWTAALRERLRGAVWSGFVPAIARLKSERAPQGRGAAFYLPKQVPNPTEADWHNWYELAKPLRIGPGGVAVASQQIAGMSDEDVVTAVCANYSKAAAQLGAEADIPRLAAMAASARALLNPAPAVPEAVVAPVVVEAPEVVADKTATAVPAARPPSDPPKTEVEHDPPPKPPD
jgi:hypothetical protein